MKFYISDASVKAAYEKLTSLDIDNASVLHIFFILKACGYTRDAYLPFTEISEKGFVPAHSLSSLFSHHESNPQKYDFISPFSMKEWKSQSPSEPLTKWVNGRIKNNIIGGATTWRQIIDIDPEQDTIKFRYNYLKKIKSLTLKDQNINIFALAIWAYRFSSFPKEQTMVELSKLFKSEFNIRSDESSLLFSSSMAGMKISYTQTMSDPSVIRKLIGVPEGQDATWTSSTRSHSDEKNPITTREEKISEIIEGQADMDKIINDLLQNYSQVILSGPPGTSKSYYAKKIANNYFPKRNVVSIQFHPKYSYQHFIGGYIVQKTDVIYSDGILFNLKEKALNNKNENYLLIIDEINRANVGQVFGETIQCLDRDNKTGVYRSQELVDFSLPRNLKIIATMNTSDRSLGVMDLAIKRRFPTIYCPSLPDLVSELCTQEIEYPLSDLLRVINEQLYSVLKNKELVIGHAFFMTKAVNNGETFYWSNHNLEMLFNYQILPMIEDFTKGNISQLKQIIGEKLSSRPEGDNFISSLKEYIINES